MKTLFITDESNEIPDEVYEALETLYGGQPPTFVYIVATDGIDPWRRLVALIRGPGQRIQEKLKWPE